MEEMVIFTRTYELLGWILGACERFPKAQRFVVTKRLQDAILDFQEALFMANAANGRTRSGHLQAADAHLNKVRLYLRYAHERTWLNGGQYQHASRLVAEVGRMLGGWLRQSR